MKISKYFKMFLKDTRNLKDIFDTVIIEDVQYNPISGLNTIEEISSEEEVNAFRNAKPLENFYINEVSLYE